MRVENREDEHQKKEDARQPGRDGGENGGGLRAKDILRHTAAESGTEPLALWSLHQDDKHHEDSNERLDHEQEIDQNGHGDGQYGKSRGFVHGEDAGRNQQLTTDYADFTDGEEGKIRFSSVTNPIRDIRVSAAKKSVSLQPRISAPALCDGSRRCSQYQDQT
jgi:hypothetical protein